MLISVHLPKTAGTSFLALLQQEYGDRLRQDYGDWPLHQASWRVRSKAALHALRGVADDGATESVACIHGHFLPFKYRPLAARYVTWLRDPAERLASHYYYWRRDYHAQTALPLHRRVVEEDWDFERFCFAPELRNVYARFLWAFPLQRFEWVGITEHYDSDARDFAQRFLGSYVDEVTAENVNHERGPGRSYIEDGALRARIERYHARDVALYHEALALRHERLKHG